MKKIKLSHDLNCPGWGLIKKDTAFKVLRYNSRWVYVELKPGCILRLARKGDCVILY